MFIDCNRKPTKFIIIFKTHILFFHIGGQKYCAYVPDEYEEGCHYIRTGLGKDVQVNYTEEETNLCMCRGNFCNGAGTLMSNLGFVGILLLSYFFMN